VVSPVDAAFAHLKQALDADDPTRASSLESHDRWVMALSTGPGPEPVDDAVVEDLAERYSRHRLEQLLGELLVADDTPQQAPRRLHVRPLRSRLHAALTVPVTARDALVLVDDAVHDLTHSVTRWMVACWAPPTTRAPVGEPAVPLADAVRIVRAELGAIRWNGALWQPFTCVLDDDSRGLAAVIGNFALQFVIAHELGHVRRGHLAVARTEEIELEADAFAARTLRTLVRSHGPTDQGAAAEVDALCRLAIRVALGVLHLVDDTYLVAGDEHPPADQRFAAACHTAGLTGAPQPLERPAELFFEALTNMVLSVERPITEVTSSSVALARPYPEAELAELAALDRAEALFHIPLPWLLDALGTDTLAGSGPPPAAVTAAAERADRLTANAGLQSVGTDRWIRFAAGRWMLFGRALGELTDNELQATLHPAPATRFCDWASWVERQTCSEWHGVILAALLVYAREGADVEGAAMTGSGLLSAVGAWLGA
jgi:hypothetical protein